MKQVGVGVVGVGLMGSLFARIAVQLSQSKLVGVADIDPGRAAELGESLDVPSFTHHTGLLAVPDLDAVVVATPDGLHLEPALAAAQAGKHLMIEKPLATTSRDARQIVDACGAAGVTLMVAHVLRFDNKYGEAFKAVRQGKLGKIVHLCARRCTSVADAKRLAGRVSITFYLGIHSIDVIQWIVGSPIVEVSAVGTCEMMQQFNVDDAVLSLLRFASGAVGMLENSWIRPEGPGASRLAATLVIMGSEGSVKIEPYMENVTFYRSNAIEPVFPSYSFDDTVLGRIGGAYRDEFEHFIDCVKTGRQPIISPQQALSAVVVCEAIEQSLKTGASVRIDQENAFIPPTPSSEIRREETEPRSRT